MKKRIDWMAVSKEHWEGNTSKIEAAISRMEWATLPCDMGFAQGEAIKGIIKNFNLKNVTHVSDSHDLAPFGLVGIRAHFKNADVDFFAVDEGVAVVMLCAIVTEKGGTDEKMLD